MSVLEIVCVELCVERCPGLPVACPDTRPYGLPRMTDLGLDDQVHG
jgi:hypothetical protein